MDFGRDEYFKIAGLTPERVTLDVHVVRLGINFTFGRDAPPLPLK